jgi:polar amino acid transport system permease protein
MNINKLAEYAPTFVDALVMTLKLGVLGILFSIIVALIIEFVHFFQVPVLKQVFNAYLQISRNTPLLIQVFILYFGLPKVGITLEAETCGIIGLTFLGGSYMYEAIHAGFANVPKGTIEGGYSVGFTKLQVLLKIGFPIGFRIAVPGIFANIVFLIKETSILSAITIAELTFRAKEIIGINYDTAESLFLLCVSYAIILIPLTIIYHRLLRFQKQRWTL